MALYRWLLRLVGDEALAEDLLSEAFLAVWRQAHRFEGRSSVSTWLLASRATRRSQLGALEPTPSWTRRAFPSCQTRLTILRLLC